MKVSQPFPNFVQGVSQQPAALRLPSHAQELLNGYCDAKRGLSKRPNTELVSLLAGSGYYSAKLHSFNKSANEQGYVLINGDGTLLVKGFDGSAASVTMTASTDYINAASEPATDFELVTVADYTFIVNRNIVPAMKADTYRDSASSSGGYYKTCIWVRAPQLNTPYNITLTGGTGVAATYNPGTTAANAETVKIASELNTQINTFGAPAFTSQVLGSVIFMHRSGNAYDVSVSDGLGNGAMVLLHGATNTPANLPPNAIDNYQVKITGSDDTNWDDYFVEWNPTSKAWIEIPKPGRTYKIDETTMPHVLRYVSPGVYAYETIPWNDCLAGDEVTNKVPSFIGKTINDLFFYRGRLGILTDSTVSLSCAGDIYNFFRTTVTSLVDSDAIDVKVSMTDPAPMRWAVEYDDTVFFFTDRAQYYIDKSPAVLSLATMAVRSPTSHEVDVLCQPIVVGDRIYYVRQRGAYASLHDFYPKADAEGKLTFASDEVTAHAPSYIVGRVNRLKGTSSGNAIVLLTDRANHKAYVFNTAFENNARVQAAIHRWEFDTNHVIRAVESNGTSLYFIFNRGEGMVLERCDLSPGLTDPGMSIKLLLDNRITEADCTAAPMEYNAATNFTYITLPYTDYYGEFQFALYGRDGSVMAKPGELVRTQQINAPGLILLRAPGDWRTDKFYVGKNYMWRHTFSPIILRDSRTAAPLTGGRVQVGSIAINYGDTAYFRAVVTPEGRDTFTYPFTTYQLGTSTAQIGSVTPLSGLFKFKVLSNNLKVAVAIESDAPFPVTLLNGDWDGQFGSQATQAAKRL